MHNEPVTLSVGEFVAVANQTLEYAYPSVIVRGELANFKVSKNRWVYFDLKDEVASVRFFGTVYQLNGPLEDGMLLEVRGAPRLHPLYGFSITIQQISLVGEGTIKQASKLLETKLAKEGLFDPLRKRPLPYPPTRIGLVTSSESAAYADFVKIVNARWSGLEIVQVEVQVQGRDAPGQIVAAIERCNQLPEPPEVLVIIRGGGSSEDLQAFSTESVVRAVAASRIPTLVAIGHEIDLSLAELAADSRASTPSNAAELLVPDKSQALATLKQLQYSLSRSLTDVLASDAELIRQQSQILDRLVGQTLERAKTGLRHTQEILEAYNPQAALGRGYALVHLQKGLVTSGSQLKTGAIVDITLQDATARAEIQEIEER